MMLIAATLLAVAAGASAQSGERVIFQAPSKFSDMLVVSEDAAGLRVLRFAQGRARQSVVKPGDPDHLELAYARAFPAGLIWAQGPERILIIGLGGGSIPTFLRKRLPKAYIDVVELDPAVLDVARSHFGFREDERLRAHIADGRDWIEKSGARYDLILLDAFSATAVPYALTTREFLTAVSRLLTPDGVVIGNLWGRFANSLYDDMVSTYLDVYRTVAVMDVATASNKLIFASHSAKLPDRAETLRRAAELTRQLELREDLVPQVERGLRAPEAAERHGRVLTDSTRPLPAAP